MVGGLHVVFGTFPASDGLREGSDLGLIQDVELNVWRVGCS